MDSSSNVWAQCLAEYAIILWDFAYVCAIQKMNNCLLESSS
jgi:hypothetical protein